MNDFKKLIKLYQYKNIKLVMISLFCTILLFWVTQTEESNSTIILMQATLLVVFQIGCLILIVKNIQLMVKYIRPLAELEELRIQAIQTNQGVLVNQIDNEYVTFHGFPPNQQLQFKEIKEILKHEYNL